MTTQYRPAAHSSSGLNRDYARCALLQNRPVPTLPTLNKGRIKGRNKGLQSLKPFHPNDIYLTDPCCSNTPPPPCQDFLDRLACRESLCGNIQFLYSCLKAHASYLFWERLSPYTSSLRRPDARHTRTHCGEPVPVSNSVPESSHLITFGLDTLRHTLRNGSVSARESPSRLGFFTYFRPSGSRTEALMAAPLVWNRGFQHF
jgi:hypothetical protein